GDHILKSTSPLVSGNALEQYESHKVLPGGIEKTFVPMRNQLFLTIAANRAYALGCKVVVTGVCQEDFGGYPDCRQKFINSLKEATALGSYNDGLNDPNALQFYTPLMNLTKAETVEMAMELPGCYGMLAYTHTSYDGQFPPTGKDHATLLRAKGFEEADWPDPLVIRAWRLGLMPLPLTKNYREVCI
ncbi:7-cyano-7-deazaguanine synthase, partial [Staphylococcus aureus]|uniref:7-cyano-7-deazaguanine synthase n=1 Tax=Staphylococcus aureus TaxID=1280 RepID=UPI0015826845